jgi:predicted unusual protein kinase regulating ubiquinone biosynthesis (AarF/ABC1/UbiB family)
MLSLQFGGEVYVPKIEKELTTQRVMVMEWIDGVKVTSESQIKEMGCVAPAANSMG